VYEQMLRIGEGDLIIGISYPRYSKRTISAMKFARDHGARCLGMTDSKVSPLNEICRENPPASWTCACR